MTSIGASRKEGVFLRTPKVDEGHRLWGAIAAARTEILLAAALWAATGALAATASVTTLLLGLLAWQGAVYASAPLMSWLDQRGHLSPDLERRRRTES
ncbi:MAG: group 2 glycosyl transferase, partial [Acidimicrobiales bacterium]